MLYFQTRGRAACCSTDGDPITTGSVGYPVNFVFDEAWDGLTKTAVFRGSGQTIKRVIEPGSLYIPPEVLVDAGDTLWIGVYGKNGAGTVVVPTIWAKAGIIRAGTDNPDDIEPDAGYEGPYTVTPTEEEQSLETEGKRMEKNVTVERIPLTYARVSQSGSTLYIR